MKQLGVWMWPKNVRERGAQRVADMCGRMGVTDIYFLAKGLAGVTAFVSPLTPSDCGRDLLQELLSAAHEKNMRVHAWFTSASDEHYKAAHPQSGRCHFSRGKDQGLISLADEGYMQYMEKVTRYLAQHYDVDGLHLDYIRYNHLLYGWDESDLKRYRQNGADTDKLKALMQRAFYGEKQDLGEMFDLYRAGDQSVRALAWTRRQDVRRFATRLTQAARAEKSDLCLSAALMPEGAYDDTAFSDLHYGQNYQDAAAIYHLALPMAYSQAYEKDENWVADVARGAMKKGLKTVMGLHAYEGGTGLTLQKDAAALENVPVEGVCLFREGAVAFAKNQGERLWLYNALDEPITRVEALQDEHWHALNTTIAPDEERELPLADVKGLRIYTGNRENCVYLAP